LASVHCFDPLRLAVRVAGLGKGVTGFQVSQQLEEEYGVVAELATSQVVLFVLGPGSQPAHAVALVDALRRIVTKFLGASSSRGVPLVYPGELITRQVLDTLRGVKASGGTVTGPADSSLDTLAVLDM
ncbi:PLP-dependent transferase, partial [Haematococcus lacustris]